MSLRQEKAFIAESKNCLHEWARPRRADIGCPAQDRDEEYN